MEIRVTRSKIVHELRVLNGLHRGATLPLGDSVVTIGSGDDADVVMVDHGIEAEHARLAPSAHGWLLSAADGVIYAHGSGQAQAALELVAGDCVRLGSSEVWLAITRRDADWTAAPLEPLVPVAPLEGFEPDGIAENAGRDSAVQAGQANIAKSGIAGAAAPAPSRPSRRSRLLAVPVAAIAMLGAAAYAYSVRPASPIPGVESALRTAAPAAPATVAVNDEILRSAFRRRLGEAGLLERFDLQLDDHEWTMRADLDDEEKARFERILARFLKEQMINFPVNARIVTAEGMLPFRIRQVVSGATPSLVTVEGQRIEVGDDYRGVRLVSIAHNRLTFVGKRKIEVMW